MNFAPEQYHRNTNWRAWAISVYSEHLLVGYRYYDAHALEFSTGFPFGHGLSYTSFTYSDLKVQLLVIPKCGEHPCSGTRTEIH